ncbi:MAG: hypothetical protein E7349_01360 [Clostridiales bacterium]|nr:hypothetical protein [Clostridiales bacterium]
MGLHDGHRARMREKLKNGNLLDHEILEVFLFNAVPRLNTNELAHRLLAAFGSLDGVFSATMEQLCGVDGVGESLAAYIYTAGCCYEKFYEAKVKTQGHIREYTIDGFIEFVQKTYGEVDREVLDVYALNDKGNILICKRFSQDSLFNVEVSPEEIGKFLMQNQASGLVMVHNHPFGEAVASESDDKVTMKCQLMCSLQNVLLCDHVIYSPNGVYSYYRSGRLKWISERCSVQNVLSNAMTSEDE